MEKPKLRMIEAFPVQHNGREMIMLRDPMHWTESSMVMSPALIPILQRFNGKNSLEEIQTAFHQETGQTVPRDLMETVINKLDEALLLESPKFHAYQKKLVHEFEVATVRPASHAGASYPAEPEKITKAFDKHFVELAKQGDPTDFLKSRGPAKHRKTEATPGSLIGLIAPHIDLRAGGPSFAAAYQELRNRTDIELFVILGTGHQLMKHHYGALRKDFATPYGTVQTDRDALDQLAGELPFGFYEDEWAHRSEHSIEFQVVYLQYLFGGRFKGRIAPILSGSFHEFSETGKSPANNAEVASFTKALRKLVEARRGKVCVIAGVDFAHLGGRFGDQVEMDECQRQLLAGEDRGMIETILSCDAEAFHRNIAADKDSRRICGYPAIYTLLKSLQPASAKFLHYGQSPEADTNSVVSFGSLAFYY